MLCQLSQKIQNKTKFPQIWKNYFRFISTPKNIGWSRKINGRKYLPIFHILPWNSKKKYFDLKIDLLNRSMHMSKQFVLRILSEVQFLMQNSNICSWIPAATFSFTFISEIRASLCAHNFFFWVCNPSWAIFWGITRA